MSVSRESITAPKSETGWSLPSSTACLTVGVMTADLREPASELLARSSAMGQRSPIGSLAPGHRARPKQGQARILGINHNRAKDSPPCGRDGIPLGVPIPTYPP